MSNVRMSPTGLASRAIKKAITMAVINPGSYRTSSEIFLELGKVVALKAATYLIEELQNIVDLNNDSNSLVKEVRAQAFQFAEILIARKLAVNLAKYYTFRINPSGLDKSFSKIRDNKLTGLGPTQDTLGNNLVQFSYQGSTGNMYPPLRGTRMPQMTAAWHYLALFEEFFVRNDDDLIFILDDDAVIGRFDSFSYGLNADNPWEIKYRFQISVYPNTRFSLLNGWVSEAFKFMQPARSISRSALNDLVDAGSGQIDVFEETIGIL